MKELKQLHFTLPKPECPHGYTRSQIEEILGSSIDQFDKWFTGQTGVFCTGYDWNTETKQYIPNECFRECSGTIAGHGPVVYPEDLERFIKGQAPFD